MYKLIIVKWPKGTNRDTYLTASIYHDYPSRNRVWAVSEFPSFTRMSKEKYDLWIRKLCPNPSSYIGILYSRAYELRNSNTKLSAARIVQTMYYKLIPMEFLITFFIGILPTEINVKFGHDSSLYAKDGDNIFTIVENDQVNSVGFFFRYEVFHHQIVNSHAQYKVKV